MATSSSLPRLIGLTSRYSGLVILSCVLSVISSMLAIAPFYFVYFIMKGFPDTPLQDVWGCVFASALCLIARPLMFGASTAIAHYAAFHILFDIRKQILNKFKTLPLGYFTGKQTGGLKRIVNENVEIFELFLSHQLPETVAALSLPVMSLATLIYVDWRLGLISLLTFPIAWGAQSLMMRNHSKKIGTYFSMLRDANGTSQEYLQNIDDIKMSGGNKQILEKFEKSVQDFKKFTFDWQCEWMAPWSLLFSILSAPLIFVLPLGYAMLDSGLLLPSTFLFAMLTVIGVGAPLLKLINYTEIYFRVAHCEKAIHVFLNEPNLEQDSIPGITPSSFDITFDRVSLNIGDEDIVRDVSFPIRSGSTTAIVGPSGAGKSTVGRLLARHWLPSEGSIRIGEVDLKTWSQRGAAAMVSLINQDVFIFAATIAENIAFGKPGASRADIAAAARAAMAHDFIVRLGDGYDTQLIEHGRNLSGGERQRLSLARALLKDPSVLILDETTSQVDPYHELCVQKAINTLPPNKTVVVISHRMDSVVKCDQVVFMQDGSVEDYGTHDELMVRSTAYNRLFKIQQKNLTWSISAQTSFQPENG